jgi:hypothetical protein
MLLCDEPVLDLDKFHIVTDKLRRDAWAPDVTFSALVGGVPKWRILLQANAPSRLPLPSERLSPGDIRGSKRTEHGEGQTGLEEGRSRRGSSG